MVIAFVCYCDLFVVNKVVGSLCGYCSQNLLIFMLSMLLSCILIRCFLAIFVCYYCEEIIIVNDVIYHVNFLQILC